MRGYTGEIAVLVGAYNDNKINDVTIIKHAETPGLGDKITGAGWLAAFKGRPLGTAFRVTNDGGDIDSFSGATISPRAVSEAVTTAGQILAESISKTITDNPETSEREPVNINEVQQ